MLLRNSSWQMPWKNNLGAISDLIWHIILNVASQITNSVAVYKTLTHTFHQRSWRQLIWSILRAESPHKQFYPEKAIKTGYFKQILVLAEHWNKKIAKKLAGNHVLTLSNSNVCNWLFLLISWYLNAMSIMYLNWLTDIIFQVRGYQVGEVAATRGFLEGAVELRLPWKGRRFYTFAEGASDLGASEYVVGNPTGYFNKPGSASSFGLGVKLGAARLECATEGLTRPSVFNVRFGERF